MNISENPNTIVKLRLNKRSLVRNYSHIGRRTAVSYLQETSVKSRLAKLGTTYHVNSRLLYSIDRRSLEDIILVSSILALGLDDVALSFEAFAEHG